GLRFALPVQAAEASSCGNMKSSTALANPSSSLENKTPAACGRRLLGTVRRSYGDRLARVIAVMVFVLVELKHIEEITDGRAVERHIGIVVIDDRVRQIVAAAACQRLQMPVALDELHNRGVVGIGVVDVASLGEGRDDDERNARPITKKVERLHEARVVVASDFVHGNDERGILGKFGMPLEPIEDAVNERLKLIELGAGRMSVSEAVRFQIRHRKQMAVLEAVKEVGRILDVGRAL